MNYSDDDKAVLLLTTRLADTDAPSLPPGMWWDVVQVLEDADEGPATLLGETLDAALPFKVRERVEQLRRMGVGLAVALDSLVSRGLTALPYTADGFPPRLRSRLGERCPPSLLVAGNANLLKLGGIGIVGSRDVDPEGGQVAAEAAGAAARAGIQVISGAARGVDQLAMRASAEAGGTVVGFLAESLTTRVRDASVRELIADGRLTLVSIQHPDAGFSVGAAMARNKLIYGTSDASLVVSTASGSGGTWAGATEALTHSYSPVLVWSGPGAGPGNEDLIGKGARSVSDVNTLFNEWPPAVEAGQPEPVQSALF